MYSYYRLKLELTRGTVLASQFSNIHAPRALWMVSISLNDNIITAVMSYNSKNLEYVIPFILHIRQGSGIE